MKSGNQHDCCRSVEQYLVFVHVCVCDEPLLIGFLSKVGWSGQRKEKKARATTRSNGEQGEI